MTDSAARPAARAAGPRTQAARARLAMLIGGPAMIAGLTAVPAGAAHAATFGYGYQNNYGAGTLGSLRGSISGTCLSPGDRINYGGAAFDEGDGAHGETDNSAICGPNGSWTMTNVYPSRSIDPYREGDTDQLVGAAEEIAPDGTVVASATVEATEIASH